MIRRRKTPEQSAAPEPVSDETAAPLVVVIHDEADEELKRANMPPGTPVFEAANELLSRLFAHSDGGVTMVSGAVLDKEGVPVFVASFPGMGGT